ncbi:autolysin sensor kinase [Klebsiella pneumoniae]|nr:autolysin sensor kinase [Klebsiella pneumoniae]
MVRAFRHVWFAGMYEFDLVLLLLQQMCVFLVIAWLMSKTRLFIPLMQVTVRLPHKLLCYVTFSIFCIMGTYFGLHIEDSIAKHPRHRRRDGRPARRPVVGGLVGLTGGLHRYSLGEWTALSCMVSTIVEGLLGGLVHSVLVKRGRPDKVFSPLTAGAITFVGRAGADDDHSADCPPVPGRPASGAEHCRADDGHQYRRSGAVYAHSAG